jgi:hypothetical protein
MDAAGSAGVPIIVVQHGRSSTSGRSLQASDPLRKIGASSSSSAWTTSWPPPASRSSRSPAT